MNKVNGISLGRFLLFYHRSCSPCLGFFTLEVKVKPRSRYPPINLTLNTNHLESPSSSNQSHHPVAGIIFRIPSSLRLSVFLVSSLLLSHTLSLPAYLTDPSSAALESHGDETTYQPLNSITFSGDIAIMSTSPSDLSEGGGAPLFVRPSTKPRMVHHHRPVAITRISRLTAIPTVVESFELRTMHQVTWTVQYLRLQASHLGILVSLGSLLQRLCLIKLL